MFIRAEGVEDVDVVFGNADRHHEMVRRRGVELEAEERAAAGLAFGEIAGGGLELP
ncbi:hypothetical protein [Mycolicibacterium moriokaense]|uniref:hypothetical protein n=1 Tax=Mycolicibacterium moriokaense TaxID=39691 RepID=UPI0015E8CAD0|nr:hypothetical protein [Mycolicibacterium moriokaense]